MLSRRSLVLQAAGAALAEGGAAYYFTHPLRVVAELPESIQAIAETVTVTATDGAELHATWIPGQGPRGRSFDRTTGDRTTGDRTIGDRTIGDRTTGDRTTADRTIVHHHGFNSCGGMLLARRALFPRMAVPLPWAEQREPLYAWPLVNAGLQRGYNFLLLDARAHGRSGGAWDPTGMQQVSDAMLWARWLREQHHQLWAGFWGNSFGGAIGLGLALRPSGGGYDAMVLDSAVVMADGVYSGAVQQPLYAAIRPVIEQLGSRELYPALQSHRPWMPILLIHGTEDGHVPAWQSERVYGLLRNPEQPGRAALWLVPGAAHLQSLEVAEEEYVRRTLDWFDKWM